MRPRLTILGMMALIGVMGVGLVGLRTATPLWASAIFTLTVAALTATTIGAALGRRTCLGFSIAGWAYMLAVFGLWPEPNGVTAPPVLTKALMDYFQPDTNTPAVVMTIDPGPQGESATEVKQVVVLPGVPGLTRLGPFTGRVINRLHYRRIGHCLAAILCGLLGSLVATVFAIRGGGTSEAAREAH
jgi:hypothetical protein